MEEIYDKNRRPIRPGDVLKVFHFVGARRKRYYMHKLVVEHDGELCGVDICDLATKPLAEAHSYHLTCHQREGGGDIEIVEGYSGGVSFEDRSKISR